MKVTTSRINVTVRNEYGARRTSLFGLQGAVEGKLHGGRVQVGVPQVSAVLNQLLQRLMETKTSTFTDLSTHKTSTLAHFSTDKHRQARPTGHDSTDLHLKVNRESATDDGVWVNKPYTYCPYIPLKKAFKSLHRSKH